MLNFEWLSSRASDKFQNVNKKKLTRLLGLWIPINLSLLLLLYMSLKFSLKCYLSLFFIMIYWKWKRDTRENRRKLCIFHQVCAPNYVLCLQHEPITTPQITQIVVATDGASTSISQQSISSKSNVTSKINCSLSSETNFPLFHVTDNYSFLCYSISYGCRNLSSEWWHAAVRIAELFSCFY